MANRWVLVLLLLGAALGGCTVVDAARGEPGVDTSGLKLGVMRTDVEAIIGSPLRDWESESGVIFALYEFDGGRPGDRDSASVLMLLNIASAGLLELYEATNLTNVSDDLGGARRVIRIIGAYRGEELVGMFDEFAPLPADGVSTDLPEALQP